MDARLLMIFILNVDLIMIHMKVLYTLLLISSISFPFSCNYLPLINETLTVYRLLDSQKKTASTGAVNTILNLYDITKVRFMHL